MLREQKAMSLWLTFHYSQTSLIRTPKGQNKCPLYRVVRITEVGYVWFLAFLGPNELSVIKRCPYYRGVRKERLDCNFLNLFYWLCICKEKINIGDFWDIKGLTNWRGGGGYSWGFLVGVAALYSKSWPYFRPKNVIFHTCFQTSTPPPGGACRWGAWKWHFFCIWTNMISSQ